jgi:hypothetical protein
MINITTAVRQMRIARKLGKISNEIQTRVMRRLGFNRMAQWESMMRLRAQIERDIAPVMVARKEAEADLFQIKCKVTERKAPVKVAPRKVKQVLTGYEYTVAWWNAMELKEREDRKAGTVARNAAKELAPA